MNAIQARTVEDIRKYVLEHDCFHNNPDYEIKEWEVMENEFFVTVRCVTGRKNDDGTLAACWCRTYRQIFVGHRGGVKGRGQNGVTKKWRNYTGWTDVMIFAKHN